MEEQRLDMTKYLVGGSQEAYSYRLRKYLPPGFSFWIGLGSLM